VVPSTHPIRERVIHAAVSDIITGLLFQDRAAMLAAILPATAAKHDDCAKCARKTYARGSPRTTPLIEELRYASAAAPAAPRAGRTSSGTGGRPGVLG
jgi:hypothetical protein